MSQLNEPRWVATLSNGETVVGRPSWLGSSVDLLLPNDEQTTDWRRLKARCAEDNLKLTGLSLYVQGRVFPAPLNKAAYGYSETLVSTLNKTQPDGVEALNIMWPEEYDEITNQHRVMKVIKVYSNGLLEHWTRPYQWLPCMIGEQLWETEGALNELKD